MECPHLPNREENCFPFTKETNWILKGIIREVLKIVIISKIWFHEWWKGGLPPLGLDVQGPSLSLLALYQHQMGESGSYPNKIGGPTLGLVSHYKDIFFLPSPLPCASEVGPCSAAQIPSTTVHSGLWERGLWMGDFPEQRHGAQNVPGGYRGSTMGGLAIWAAIPGSQW